MKRHDRRCSELRIYIDKLTTARGHVRLLIEDHQYVLTDLQTRQRVDKLVDSGLLTKARDLLQRAGDQNSLSPQKILEDPELVVAMVKAQKQTAEAISHSILPARPETKLDDLAALPTLEFTADGQAEQFLLDDLTDHLTAGQTAAEQHLAAERPEAAIESLHAGAGSLILDACCGTGDLALALLQKTPSARVIGSDFSLGMLQAGRNKNRSGHHPAILAADTLHLPFADCTFDGAMVGFGMRNVVDVDAALRELRRVLRPGGRLMILEFTPMQNRWIRPFSDFYQSQILPRLGNRLSGSQQRAYSYLDESVRDWPDAERLAQMIRNTPLHAVRHRTLFPGNVAVHEAVRG